MSNMDRHLTAKASPPREFWRVWREQASQSDNDAAWTMFIRPPENLVIQLQQCDSKRLQSRASKLHSSGDASHGTSLTTQCAASSPLIYILYIGRIQLLMSSLAIHFQETTAAPTRPSADARADHTSSSIVDIHQAMSCLACTEVDHQIQVNPASIQKEASAIDAQVPSEP
ncbi:hypothetical protein BASA60_001473 [Batrachochytrium salamandrivorans]|nr:hypothetical protein BASA60_001473 [Batrachochytrium salamandrivorans]